jgi:hypothetical protein
MGKEAMTDARVVYDEHADVLYITIGESEPSTVVDDDDGRVWRFSRATGRPSGVTIIGFQEGGWGQEIEALEAEIWKRLQVPAEVIDKALRSAA